MTARIRILIISLGFLVGYSGATLAQADTPVDAGSAVAVASGVGSGSAVAVPDPLTAPGDSIGLVEKLYKSGALVDVGILVAFFLLTIAASKVPWLREDHRSVYVSAALGGLALLTVPAAQGTTPTLAMVMSAIVTVVGLAMNPKKAAQA